MICSAAGGTRQRARARNPLWCNRTQIFDPTTHCHQLHVHDSALAGGRRYRTNLGVAQHGVERMVMRCSIFVLVRLSIERAMCLHKRPKSPFLYQQQFNRWDSAIARPRRVSLLFVRPRRLSGPTTGKFYHQGSGPFGRILLSLACGSTRTGVPSISFVMSTASRVSTIVSTPIR
jgi:hypothetical protein